MLPELNEGEIVTVNKIDPKQNFTDQPSRYTEASLIRAMEEKYFIAQIIAITKRT